MSRTLHASTASPESQVPESSLALEKRQNRREANPREGAVRRLAEVGSLKEVDPPRHETDARQRFYDLTATGRQVVARETATPKATRVLRANRSIV